MYFLFSIFAAQGSGTLSFIWCNVLQLRLSNSAIIFNAVYVNCVQSFYWNGKGLGRWHWHYAQYIFSCVGTSLWAVSPVLRNNFLCFCQYRNVAVCSKKSWVNFALF